MKISNQIKSIAYGVLISSFFTIALQGEAKGATLVVNPLDTLNQSQLAQVSITGAGQTPKTTSTSQSLTTTGLLNGTTRTLTVGVTNANNTGTVEGNIQTDFGGNSSFTLNTPTSIEANAVIDYGTFTAIDFTQGGADRLFFNIIESDLAANNLSVTVNGDTVTKTIGQKGFDPLDVTIFFNEFNTADFTQVTSFELALNLTNPVIAGDVSIDVIATGKEEVPEPSALIPILGLGGLILTSRRKKSNQDKNDKID